MKKKKIFILSLIILLSIFLRFFRIKETVTFLGDQGRDLVEIRTNLLAHRLPLSGPLSNLGIHAGPAYYYFIIPSLLLSKFQPLGPILFISALGIMTTFLIYFLNSELFGFLPALLASAIYASSALVIKRTIGLWNPIPIPFFSILIFLSFYQIQEKKRTFWFAFLGLFLGIAIQLYPPAYFLILAVLFWYLYLRCRHFPFGKWPLIGIFTFILSLLPFFVFQIQTQFADLRNLLLIFLEKLFVSGGLTETKPASSVSLFFKLLSQQFQALSNINSMKFNLWLGIIIIILPLLLKNKKAKIFWHLFLSLWFTAGLLILIFYPDEVQPHYTSFLWIMPFLLFASFLKALQKLLSPKILFAVGFIFVFFQINSYFSNLSPTYDLPQAELSSRLIIKELREEPFSLLLHSPRSLSDEHLRYLLLLKKAKLREINNQQIKNLVFVCDENACPKQKDLKMINFPDSKCLPACPPLGQQKLISFQGWKLIKIQAVSKQKIYFFKKSNN